MRSLLCVVALAGCVDAAPEPDAVQQLHEEALPYYEAGTSGRFIGAAGAEIAYQAFLKPGATRAIVFAPGRTEGSHTFMQLAYDLRDEPYDLYVIDHRGQGASDRLTADPRAGFVDNFQYYVDDYDQLVREVVLPHGYAKLYALAHSMGGAITLDYVLAHPDTFAAVALSAPMLQIDASPLSEDSLLWYASSVTPEEMIPLGDDGSNPQFANNYLTTDPDQFRALYETDKIFPERSVGRATYGWTAESIRADQALRARAADVVPPVVLFQAGQDHIVVPASQTEFCATAPHCKLVTLPTARHELFFATAAVRTQIHDEIFALFAAN